MIPLFGRSRCSIGILLSLLLVGCSREAKLYPVSGSVSLDGQPVSEGDILFVSPDGVRGPDAGKIEGGKYALKTTDGKKRVEVSAAKIRPGGARGAGGEPVPEEYIPARYNTASELSFEVKPAAENIINLDLKSK